MRPTIDRLSSPGTPHPDGQKSSIEPVRGGDGQFRTKTGSSIVAVIREGDTTPAPGPEFEFRSRDVAVAVGTVEGLATLRDVMRH